ncbi:MAG: hypothetical protein AB7P99_13975 [Vicinamibacterales bacterium]
MEIPAIVIARRDRVRVRPEMPTARPSVAPPPPPPTPRASAHRAPAGPRAGGVHVHHEDTCPDCAEPGCVCGHVWGESCRCGSGTALAAGSEGVQIKGRLSTAILVGGAVVLGVLEAWHLAAAWWLR